MPSRRPDHPSRDPRRSSSPNPGARRANARSAAARRDIAPALEPPPGAQSPWVQLRAFTSHPFIYKRMLRAADRAARLGEVINVYDKNGEFFGRGLYNPRSEIAVRMLTYKDVPIDDAFWRDALGRAAELRYTLRIDEVSDAYRLVHAEGDGLSGLIVERYADCLVLEVFALGMYQRAAKLATLLSEILPAPTSLDRPGQASDKWHVIVRADERVESIEGFKADAPADGSPTSTVIREHDIRYRVEMTAGHKTGFFCDQRDNRLRFARLCRDADVLDCCCYTGGFGLCAKLIGGAREVTSVDLDEAALATARQNGNLNQTRVNLVHSDAFAYLRQMFTNKRQYDAIVLDPPKLATSRREYDDALRKYEDLNTLAVQIVRPGGMFLTCSCSGLVSEEVFQQIVQRAARRARRTIQIFDRTGAAPDHPVLPNCPESSYLKALWLRVM